MGSGNEVWLVAIWATITALATGLGAVPFLFRRQMPASAVGIGNALAAGLMLGASFNLIYEGNALSLWRTTAGALLGLALVAISRRFLKDREEMDIGQLRGADAIKAMLIVGIMTVHSFAEGIGVGVSFGESETFGGFISAAIAVHNIPEGLAISLVLIPRGVKIWHAAGWSIFSSLPQPLLAVPAFLFVEAFTPFLPVGLGIAGGAMIWMVFAELAPESLEKQPAHVVGTWVTISLLAMLVFQALIHI